MNKQTMIVLALIGQSLLPGMAQAATSKTENFILKAKVEYGEEGIFLNTNKGRVALNSYTLPEKVLESFGKLKLNKGACIEVKSVNGLMAEDEGGGSGIQTIRNCAAKGKK
jgi:hypothetical protein